jgi:hypothetical protein
MMDKGFCAILGFYFPFWLHTTPFKHTSSRGQPLLSPAIRKRGDFWVFFPRIFWLEYSGMRSGNEYHLQCFQVVKPLHYFNSHSQILTLFFMSGTETKHMH